MTLSGDEILSKVAANKPQAEKAEATAHVRQVDHAVLELLRDNRGSSVPELVELLGVTATAVRQRLDRLIHQKLVQRLKQGEGRGRPSYRYELTSAGWRELGTTYADLAIAMWCELAELPDPELRNKILSGVSARMANALRAEIDPCDGGESAEMDAFPPEGELYESNLTGLKHRMQGLAEAFTSRKVPASVVEKEGLPVLEVHACPYPNMDSDTPDRSFCELEKQVLEQTLGKKVHLTECRLDGDGCCKFTASEVS